jgi:hypothetical protein
MQEPSAQTDISRRRSLVAIAAWIVFALLAIVATALLFYWLWSLTDRLDADAERRGLTPQLMQRKTTAMLAIQNRCSNSAPWNSPAVPSEPMFSPR